MGPREPITHDDRIVMLGSCFTDSVGGLLARDGFNVTANPLGVLYNPLSIAQVVQRAMVGAPYTIDDLTERDGVWHCLELESRRQDTDPQRLLDSLNGDLQAFANNLRQATVWIITFGTSWVFELDGQVVGNCHKLDSRLFDRRRLDIDEITAAWQPVIGGRRVIFTVSPIRHLADGLHGNQLSKATLLLTIDRMGAEYFPAYEILNDDLRDYRFYAADLKHPSPMAVDYVYEVFEKTYFTAETRQRALLARQQAARAAHRPIIK